MTKKTSINNNCPNCNIPLAHINGVKDRRVLTTTGLKEFSFNSVDFCRKCDYKKQYYDIINKGESK